MAMSDMNSMPLPELITSLREQAAALPNSDFIRILFINCIANRLDESQAQFTYANDALKYIGDPQNGSADLADYARTHTHIDLANEQQEQN